MDRIAKLHDVIGGLIRCYEDEGWVDEEAWVENILDALDLEIVQTIEPRGQ